MILSILWCDVTRQSTLCEHCTYNLPSEIVFPVFQQMILFLSTEYLDR